MSTNEIDNKARIIQKLLNELGSDADFPTILERYHQLDNGLINEDEFIYILNWSKSCSLIHKLDQSLVVPLDYKKHYSIPDLFVIFEKDGVKKPFYIEIKTSQKEKLDWTESYYEGLKNYSEITGIPVLVAWKWNVFSIWTLFEIEHFQKPNKNYKMNLEMAIKMNLMYK